MVVRIVSLVLFSFFVSIIAAEIDLHAKFLELESVVTQQGIRIQELQGIVEKHENTIVLQNTLIEGLYSIVRKSENAITDQQMEIDRLNDIIRKFEYISKSDSTISVSNPNGTIEYYQPDKNNTKNKDRRLIGETVPLQPSTVAFYSYLGHNEPNLTPHYSLIFDVVISNFGNGYNKHTGAFIAPVNGVYVLTLTVFPYRGTLTAINILRNSEVVGQVFGDMRNSGILSGSTATVVVTMNKGDAATVITSSIHPSSGILGSDDNMKTSFAGWKIGDFN